MTATKNYTTQIYTSYLFFGMVLNKKLVYFSVLRIRDILVRIRIQMRGSVPLTYRSGFGSATGSGYESCYFRQ
jgi:hypothetical protein